MGRVNTPILSKEQRSALENGFKTGKSHAFRMRCQCILLKAANRKSKDVGKILGICHVSVNSWVYRYKHEGIDGLLTKEGRGRKPKIDKTLDKSPILASVKSNRQRLQKAKTEWESESNKSVSRDTFRRFLKVLADDTKG